MVVLAVCALTATTAPASSATAAGPPRQGALDERAAAAVGSGGPLPGDLHGPVVTHPVQEEVDYPAGEVCPFPSHAEFPVNDLTIRTWYDEKDRPVFATESGPLVMVVTNLATGRKVTRDISGSGTITYLSAGSYILSGRDWGVGFRTADRPMHNRWIISRGSMSVQITKEGGTTSRTLLDLRGPHENLCETLGGDGSARKGTGPGS